MLFPSNAYGHNYGGDPAVIPTLTMKKYRAFYERFYHPSNALAFLYGKIDIAPMLKLVASYLRRYPRREIPAQIPLQPPVSAERVVEYPCDAVVDRTRICEGWVFGTWRDGEKETAMNVVRDILAGSNEAPLTKALLDAGVCENFSMACFDGHQNRIHATFTNVRDGKIDEARRIFRETLERQIKEGFDVKKISAALDKLEFWTREPRSLDPAGIRRLSPVVDSWLYGGFATRTKYLNQIKALRRRNGTGYFERLASKTLLENPHRATLILKPTNAHKPKDLTLPAPGPKAPEDKSADLAKIPRLRLADVPEKGNFTTWRKSKVGGIEVVRPKVEPNGIVYADLAFAVDDLTDEELLDLPLLERVLAHVPAGGRNVSTLRREIDSHFGALNPYPLAMDGGVFFFVSMSFLPAHAKNALRILKDILSSSNFSCEKEVRDIRKQMAVSFENKLLRSGYSVASTHAARVLSPLKRAAELLEGLAQYRHRKYGTHGDLAKLAAKVFVRGRLAVSVANQPSPGFAHRLINIVPKGGPSGRPAAQLVRSPVVSDGFITKGQGSFTAMCAWLPKGVAYSGSFDVASQILTLDYFLKELRVKGGAYGGSFNVDPSGMVSLRSWNDPHPELSFDVFMKCGQWLRAFVKSGQAFENYKVSMSGDSHFSAAVEAGFAFALFHLNGVSVADRQRRRSEILHATADDLLRFADILDEILPNATRCVIGEEKLVRRCGLSEFEIDKQK